MLGGLPLWGESPGVEVVAGADVVEGAAVALHGLPRVEQLGARPRLPGPPTNQKKFVAARPELQEDRSHRELAISNQHKTKSTGGPGAGDYMLCRLKQLQPCRLRSLLASDH